MRVLVTGSNGMIATQAIAVFDGTVELWTTSRSEETDPHHIPADLADPDQTAAMIEATQPNAVLHLAGSTGGSLSRLIDSNVVATVNLMQAVSEGTHVVVVGSAAEYGTGSEDLIDESVPLRPLSQYGWTKASQTESALAIAQRRDIATAIARPFNVVGPALPQTSAFGNIKTQITAARPGEPIRLTTGKLDIIRDLVPIEFVADVLVAMTLDPAGAGTFNICTGQGVLLLDVVETVAQLTSTELDLEVDTGLAGLPAAHRIVGNPQKVKDVYNLGVTPTVADIAGMIVGKDGGTTARQSTTVSSARSTTKARGSNERRH